MLERLSLKNFTVFPIADLTFGQHLNVIVGENGTGKTHVLKVAYSVLAVSAEQGRKLTDAPPPTKSALEVRLTDKLANVFRPERLSHLIRREAGNEQRCEVSTEFDNSRMNIGFVIPANDSSGVTVNKMPTAWLERPPAYLPTRELLTIYPNFVSVYENHYLNFEETWRDTCILLGALVQRGPKEEQVQRLLKPLEEAMGGKIELDRNGKFYLATNGDRMEMSLVAEGLRKLGMLAQLISTGVLLDRGYLFWDEPEANLNPKLVQRVARSILAVASGGIQVFIATHSLFLLRELEILLSSREFKKLDTRFIGLHSNRSGVSVQQGRTADDIGDIAALDEALRQSDRFLAEK
jgi:predicted ATPase